MQTSDTFATVSSESPLGPAARGTLVVAAAATSVLFYAASVASLAVLTLLIGVLFLGTLAAARFGMGVFVSRRCRCPHRCSGSLRATSGSQRSPFTACRSSDETRRVFSRWSMISPGAQV